MHYNPLSTETIVSKDIHILSLENAQLDQAACTMSQQLNQTTQQLTNQTRNQPRNQQSLASLHIALSRTRKTIVNKETRIETMKTDRKKINQDGVKEAVTTEKGKGTIRNEKGKHPMETKSGKSAQVSNGTCPAETVFTDWSSGLSVTYLGLGQHKQKQQKGIVKISIF